MRLRFLIPACLIATHAAVAQSEANWRVAAVAGLGTRVLEVNSTFFPDSNHNQVSLGLAFGAEVGRAWRLQPTLVASATARLTTAKVESETGGVAWSPGRAFMADVVARLERRISSRMDLFAGGGVSHWSGPDDTAPFAGIGAVLLATEAGLILRPGEGAIRIDLTANLTRIAGDESRGRATGFVWRFMVGLRNGR